MLKLTKVIYFSAQVKRTFNDSGMRNLSKVCKIYFHFYSAYVSDIERIVLDGDIMFNVGI